MIWRRKRREEAPAGQGVQRVLRRPGAQEVQAQHDGQPLRAYQGETLLAALLAERGWTLRASARRGRPRGPFCGMGLCMDCLVHVQGRGVVCACGTLVEEGMICHSAVPDEAEHG